MLAVASATGVLVPTLVCFFDDHHNGKPNSVDPTVMWMPLVDLAVCGHDGKLLSVKMCSCGVS